jgi:phosphonate transport system ATP-binding protein
MTRPALALQISSADYQGKRVLEPISLTLARGEHAALVGASGAGKTTLLSLCFQASRRRAAWIPQEAGLVQSLSVFHNVYMGRLAQHPFWYNLVNLIHPMQRESRAVCEVLTGLGMEHHLKTPVGKLSGGQKQRTAVARALFQQGDLLLADEPVSALDIPRAGTVMTQLCQRFPTSLIALHDVELALRFCQRIIGIEQGRLVLDQPADRLCKNDLLAFY